MSMQKPELMAFRLFTPLQPILRNPRDSTDKAFACTPVVLIVEPDPVTSSITMAADASPANPADRAQAHYHPYIDQTNPY